VLEGLNVQNARAEGWVIGVDRDPARCHQAGDAQEVRATAVPVWEEVLIITASAKCGLVWLAMVGWVRVSVMLGALDVMRPDHRRASKLPGSSLASVPRRRWWGRVTDGGISFA